MKSRAPLNPIAHLCSLAADFARRHILTLALCAATIASGHSRAQTTSSPAPVLRVESGLLRGIATNDVVSFLGVPYARPPVGPLRWTPPERPQSWRDIRDATKPCEMAAQGVVGSPNSSTNEDCLYLNITAPRIDPKARLKPVMVWLYGGGFSGGTAKSYNARRMVTEGDVIVVTVEFRVNIFGCFGYPGLKDSGTFILLDHQAL